MYMQAPTIPKCQFSLPMEQSFSKLALGVRFMTLPSLVAPASWSI